MALNPHTAQLSQRIVQYLQEKYRKTGVNDPVAWRTIWIELVASEDEFSRALQAAASQSDIVFDDADYIKLKTSS